jgi:hypothetical protein
MTPPPPSFPAPCAPPPAPLPPILGVRFAIGAMWALGVVATAVYFYISRRALSLAPSALAVTGTRWCEPGSGPSTRRRAALFGFRFSMALWQATVISADFANPHAKHGPGITLCFYTTWNYLLQTVTWSLAATASASSLCSVRGPSALLRCATHTAFSVCLACSMLVSLVTWTILLPQDLMRLQHERGESCAGPVGQSSYLGFFSYNEHAVNCAALLLEWSINRLLLQRSAFGFVFAWMLLYSAFTWVQQAYTGLWPYFFMRVDTWAAVGWYAALPILHVCVFGVAYLLSQCKASRQPTLVESGSASSTLGLREALSPSVVVP